ncbi:MAG: RuBisCO large subunit C-terminal-like domain-containing protein [Candidatus Hodarchaeota archaeon]
MRMIDGVEINETFYAQPDEIDPDENLIAVYYVETDFPSTVKAGEQIAIEESIGTWTEVTTSTERIKKNLPAKVFKYDKGGTGIVKIAFPTALFDLETGGIPNILSMIAGNLFGLGSLRNVRLLNVDFPKSFVKAFSGPKFGIQGIRKIAETERSGRPHLGTIVKPKVGLTPKEMAKVAYEASLGGVDLVKDDETLASQRFCPFEERLTKVMEKLDEVKEETGRRPLYALNITSKADRMFEMADQAVEQGANCIMVDVILTGFSALRVLAEDPSIKVPIHVHRTMHGAFTRNPKHGISMKVVAKLVRLAGGDQLHTGTAAGKMGLKEELEELKEVNSFLLSDWHGLKGTFPVASGGIHPRLVPENVVALGKDVVINAGGGIHGHPKGTRFGAKAMKQAIEATTRNISLEEYSKDHEELRMALEHWPPIYSKKSSFARDIREILGD